MIQYDTGEIEELDLGPIRVKNRFCSVSMVVRIARRALVDA